MHFAVVTGNCTIPDMILSHDLNKSLELRNPHREQPLWRYVYGGKPKPFFHPLCTPAGYVLSIFEPHDHLWHRGLWFTIKFVNEDNFWEEKSDEPWGTQKTLLPPDARHGDDGRITVTSKQDWYRPNITGASAGTSANLASAGIVFHEDREFVYRPLSDRAYTIDFSTTLLPTMDLKLDRTPYTTWGGYGGLTFRGNRNWQETRLLFSDGTTSDRPLGYRASWCDLSGKFDGGPHATGGIAIFDHPKNPRHPTPWYGGTGPGHYFNAAFLFHEPMLIEAGQPLKFAYRVLVHDGMMDRAELQKEYEAYC
jgi:hypothetical protein